MNGFDELWVWNDAAVTGSLGWYRHVASSQNPATSGIARRPTHVEVRESYSYARKLGLKLESITFEKKTMGLRV